MSYNPAYTYKTRKRHLLRIYLIHLPNDSLASSLNPLPGEKPFPLHHLHPKTTQRPSTLDICNGISVHPKQLFKSVPWSLLLVLRHLFTLNRNRTPMKSESITAQKVGYRVFLDAFYYKCGFHPWYQGPDFIEAIDSHNLSADVKGNNKPFFTEDEQKVSVRYHAVMNTFSNIPDMFSRKA
jgi:hypothetical protein